MAHGPVSYDLDRLESLRFMPFNNNDFTGNTYDLDPDQHFYSLPECNYYVEDQLNVLLSKRDPLFSLLHLNIRSLNQNLQKLTSLLSMINNTFSCIGITETWLQHNNTDYVNIEGYNFIHQCRKEKNGGGIGLYVKNNLEFKRKSYLDFSDPEILECLFIEVERPNENNIIIGVTYRPPGTRINESLQKLNEILDRISKEGKPCYLMGDFNIDLLKYNTHTITNDFLDQMFSNTFSPLITRPTRITSHTATLIDNIFTNNVSLDTNNGLLFTDISDHLPVFTLVYHDTNILPEHLSKIKITRRQINNLNKAKFKTELNSIDWFELYKHTDPDKAYEYFLSTYNKAYEQCFPFETLSRKKSQFLSKPWISKGLQNSIKLKNKLYKKYLKKPNPFNENKYKNYKNKLNHSLKLSKKNYYQNKLETIKTDLKAVWKLLNEVINRRKTTSKLPNTFMHNNEEITNPMDIANKFCEYFTNVGPNLAKKIPNSNINHRCYLKDKFQKSVYFNPVTKKELEDMAVMFKSGKAPGFDNVTTNDVKSNIKHLSEPLAHVINLSISTGSVPKNLKIARVIPIYKSDNPSLFSNYRPISILPIFSKFLEKVIFRRLTNFTDKHSILF